MKKRVFVIVIALIAVFGFYHYRTMNVFDEMYMVGKKLFFVPYTDTDYKNFNVRSLNFDEINYWNVIGGFKYKENQERSIDVFFKKNEIIMVYSNLVFGDFYINFDCRYNLWTKCFKPYIALFDGKTDTRISDIKDANQILKEFNMDLDAVYELYKTETEEMIEDWIKANKGKTHFTLKDYGVCFETHWILNKRPFLIGGY